MTVASPATWNCPPPVGHAAIARAHGTVTQAALDKLKEGVEIAGVRYGPIEAMLDAKPQESTARSNVWLTVGLREGKNREVRKILESLGLTVNRLIRTSFGPFQLLDLKPGEVEHVKRSVLREQLGRQAAADLGIADDDESARMPRKPTPPKPKGWA